MSEAKREVPIREKVADSREPGIIRMKLYETGWLQKTLYSGDYYLYTYDFKKVGITRKTVDDLLSSLTGTKMANGMRKKPFPKQLEEMLDEFPIRIILLEGSWQMVRPTQKIISNRGVEYHTWSMVWNFLRRWQDKGFTLELTINEGHTIQRLNELYALYQKPYSMSSLTKDITDDRVLAFPSGCRGKTAMKVLDHFGSLLSVAAATPWELVKVPDVGDKKAFLIHSHFNKGEPDFVGTQKPEATLAEVPEEAKEPEETQGVLELE